MDRRSFLKSTSIAAGAAGIVAAPGVDAALASPAILRSAEPLTIAVDWPQATPVLGELGWSPGAPARAVVGWPAAIEMAPEAAASGDLRLGVVGGSGVGGLPLTFATAIPGGLQDEAHVDWLRFGGGSELLDEAAAAHGLKLFHAGSLCSQPGLWLKRSVKLTPQMRGLSVAAFGLGADVATALGCLATRIASPWSTELSGREFDAIDAVDPLIDLMAGRPGAHETLWSPGLNSSGFHLSLSIDRAVWERDGAFGAGDARSGDGTRGRLGDGGAAGPAAPGDVCGACRPPAQRGQCRWPRKRQAAGHHPGGGARCRRRRPAGARDRRQLLRLPADAASARSAPCRR